MSLMDEVIPDFALRGCIRLISDTESCPGVIRERSRVQYSGGPVERLFVCSRCPYTITEYAAADVAEVSP